MVPAYPFKGHKFETDPWSLTEDIAYSVKTLKQN